ncbi:type 1 glutamine amidotransferase [Alphaproteobacteria bacterium KMM 3653]|uniref:Type 1 glutamine amidotransferase n=1 Tax=Harenicola maris TaxID=2841044 RepID=A0AAP2CVB1_9RHOB|nr:type 1 glutamine amidotransferase [Harenicola maris]
MLIGILQTGHALPEVRDKTGDFDAMFERLLGGRDFTFRTWDVVDMDFPNSVEAADGWLITGSKHGAYEDHPFIPPLEGFIRSAYAKRVPMVGVCFGHQIIAQAMGGKVEKFHNGFGLGRQTYTYGTEEIALNAWHQDQVITAPDMATTVITNGFCQHAGLLYDDRIFTMQPHPEFDATMIQGLIDIRGYGVGDEQRLAYAQSNIDKPTDSARVAEDIGDFFLMARASADKAAAEAEAQAAKGTSSGAGA